MADFREEVSALEKLGALCCDQRHRLAGHERNDVEVECTATPGGRGYGRAPVRLYPCALVSMVVFVCHAPCRPRKNSSTFCKASSLNGGPGIGISHVPKLNSARQSDQEEDM